MIRHLYPDVQARFGLINRTSAGAARRHDRRGRTACPARPCPHRTLHEEGADLARRQQLCRARADLHARLPGLARPTSSLPEYELRAVDGQFELRFAGPWMQTTMWEIPALAILNELRARSAMKGMGRFELDVLYARAKAKLWGKVERLRALPDLVLSDFGTRRRHGFLWQRWCVEALKEGLGDRFIGTSNVLLAMDNDLEAIGTNAHELPMVHGGVGRDSDDEVASAPYRVLEDWRQPLRGQPADRPARTRSAPPPSSPARPTGWRTGRGSARTARHRSRVASRLSPGGRPMAVIRGEKLLIFSDGMDADSIEADLPPLPWPRADELRLGHQSYQRFPWLRTGRRDRAGADLAGRQGDERQRPPRRQALRQSRQGNRRRGRDRPLCEKSSGTEGRVDAAVQV